MNRQQKEFSRIRLLQELKHTSRFGRKEGYVKVYHNNSYIHEKTKFEIVYKLKKLGFEVYTECEFSHGCRGDIVAIQDGKGWIIEVIHSETEEQFELKKQKYPEEFILTKVNTKDFKIEEFEI